MGMDLGLAGALSGAGEGASKALTMAQAQWGAERIQTMRDAMDNDRQARLLEHQANEGKLNRAQQSTLQGEQQTFQHGENVDATVSREKIAENQNTTTKDISKEQNTTTREVAGAGNTSHEKIAKSSQENALEIAKLNNAMHERVAKLQRDLQTKQFDKTFTASKMTAATTALKDLSDQMIHLNAVVSNPLADHTSPDYKSAVEILQKASRLHMVYQQQLADMISSGPGGVPASPDFPGKVGAAQAPTQLPAFVPPPVAKPPVKGLANEMPAAD
jgi:hypothetical protein